MLVSQHNNILQIILQVSEIHKKDPLKSVAIRKHEKTQ